MFCTIIMSTGAVSTFGPSESSFASVVDVPKMLKPWQKLSDDKMLAQLHKKYWGTPLQLEEARSVKHEPTSDCQCMNKSSKCYADESEDADIVPGCFVLRFEDRLRFMEYRSIWIRVSASL
jgi:hypothetical protein